MDLVGAYFPGKEDMEDTEIEERVAASVKCKGFPCNVYSDSKICGEVQYFH